MEKQTVHTPPPPQQPTIPQKPKPPFLLIGLAALVLILLASTGYLAFQNYQLRKEISQLQSSPSPTPTPDPTANWKKHTNTKYNFSFKYPPDLAVQEAQNSIYYEVVLRDKNQVPVLDILINQNNSLPIDTFQSQGSKTIGAITWQVYYSPKIEGGPDPSKNVDELQLRRQQNGYWFILRFYGQKELAETQTQILSTFKFLDESDISAIKKAGEAALREKLGEKIQGEIGVGISSAQILDNWAFGNLTETNPDVPGQHVNVPDIYLFVAKKINGIWKVAIEPSQLFKDWIKEAPEELLSKQSKETLLQSIQ